MPTNLDSFSFIWVLQLYSLGSPVLKPSSRQNAPNVQVD